MEDHSKGYAANTNATRRPAIGRLGTRRKKNITTKGQGITSRESKKKHLRSQDACCHVLWVAINALQIVLFTAGLWYRKTELEKDG